MPSTYDNANGGFDHGFTGHEHDDEWGVINMRGRLYDPAMRRMLSPDPVVVDPYASQAYNRYAYVLNDPLNLTDPTGFTPEGGSCHDCSFSKAEGSFVYGDPSGGASGGQGRETDPAMAGVQADIAAGRLPSQMELAHDGAGRLGRAMEGINMGPTGPGGLSRWTMSPGSSLGALVVLGDTQGRVENWETLTDDSASGGDRAGALGWEVLAALPGVGVVLGATARGARLLVGLKNIATRVVAEGGRLGSRAARLAQFLRTVRLRRHSEHDLGVSFRAADNTRFDIGRLPDKATLPPSVRSRYAPHYHRRRLDPDGGTQHGQGISRHRPWETRPSDNNFWDRF